MTLVRGVERYNRYNREEWRKVNTCRQRRKNTERKERLTESGSCAELVISSGGHLEIPVVQLGEVTFDPHSLLW